MSFLSLRSVKLSIQIYWTYFDRSKWAISFATTNLSKEGTKLTSRCLPATADPRIVNTVCKLCLFSGTFRQFILLEMTLQHLSIFLRYYWQPIYVCFYIVSLKKIDNKAIGESRLRP